MDPASALIQVVQLKKTIHHKAIGIPRGTTAAAEI